MQSRVSQVGPLVAGSATKIALAQSPAAAGALALNGAAGVAVANNIAASQSVVGASALLLNGVLATGSPAVAWLPNPPQPIYLTSAGNDSAITFAVVGVDINNVVQTETLHGTNAGVVGSTKSYARILSIKASGSTASTVSVGTMGPATLDAARQIIFTSSGVDTGITISISGTDWAGTPISETVTGASAAAVATVLGYMTVTQVTVSGAAAGTISVGTNAVAYSPWLFLDSWALGATTVQVASASSPTFAVESSNDDPNFYADPIPVAQMVWDDAYITTTLGAIKYVASAPVWVRLNITAPTTTSIRMTVVQQGAVPY